MSRAESYGAFYRDFRARLLHQTYAFCGNTEVAQRSVSDAFVSAGHHWRKLENSAEREAWVREQAFRATGRAQNRARKPWYVSAKSIADEHRPLLGVLSRLDPADRKLVILVYLVGLDIPAAGRETGVTDSAAHLSLEGSLAKLAVARVATTAAGLHAALDRLRLDLADQPIDPAGRLRREGNRRRRSHLLLAGVSALALAVGAGALTATQSPAQSSGESPPPTPATPTAPAEEAFTADSLATTADVEVLDRSAHWSTVLTSSDFGDDQPVSECIVVPPSEKRADHYWVRRFSAGRGAHAAQAAQALEVAPSADVAEATYAMLLGDLATCRDGGRQLLDYRVVSGIGDAAGIFTFRYVDGDRVSDEIALLARTGMVVETWVVRPQTDSVRSRQLLKLGGQAVDAVCTDAEGTCSTTPYNAVDATPPAEDNPGGFLETVDLPVFGGIAESWAATAVGAVSDNPSATNCDDADFTAEGASRLTSRTYVVPGSKQLPRSSG